MWGGGHFTSSSGTVGFEVTVVLVTPLMAAPPTHSLIFKFFAFVLNVSL